MRVAIVVKEFPPDSIGGLQTQTKRMATELAEAREGSEVVLFTKRYRPHDDSELPFDVVRVPQLGVSPFVSDLTFLIGCFLALLWHSGRIDCIQCMTIYPIGFLGLMVNRITSVPYFAWIRGNDFYQMRHVWWKRWMIRRVLADTRVLVQSEEIEADVREFLPNIEINIGVLGNGITVPEETADLNSNTVLFVGRLAPKKGVEYLIKAISKVSSDAELWIIGDGDKRPKLETLANDLEIDVSFYGEVDPEEVNRFYRQASIFVLPSTEGEGMPNSVLEAMAHGVPIITTRSGGLPTIITDGQNGYLVPMRDPEAIAKRVDDLLADSSLRHNIGTNGNEYVIDNHSWDTLVSGLNNVYRECTQPNR